MGRNGAPRLIRVRRRGPRPAVWLMLLLAAALAAFVAVARPAISRLTVDLEKEAVSPQRITRDVTLEGKELWLIALDTLPQAQQARVEAARYVSRGAAGYLLEQEEGWAILGNGYAREEEAGQVARSLLAQEGIQARVIRKGAPALPLRVTATEQELSSLTRAALLSHQAPEELAAHALALDRGERQMDQVAHALSLTARQLEEAGVALHQAAGSSADPVIGGLLHLVNCLARDLEALSHPREDTLLSYSSKIKYAHLSGALKYMDLLQGLAE